MKDFRSQEASNILFIPESDSFINIDGEIYENDSIYITIIPAWINLIGRTAPFEDFTQEYISSSTKKKDWVIDYDDWY